VIGHDDGNSTIVENDATFDAGDLNEGDTVELRLATDYAYSGNIGHKIGSGGLKPGASSETRPRFILVNDVISVKLSTNSWATKSYKGNTLSYIEPTTYASFQVTSIDANSAEFIDVTTTVVREPADPSVAHEIVGFYDASTSMEAASFSPNAFPNRAERWGLEAKRSYVTGNGFEQGSTYPDTWSDQPYSTGIGLTQIEKTVLSMDNTTRATVFKLAPNEFMRIWKNKFLEHRMLIANSMYWSHLRKDTSGTKTKQFTQGTLDYILQYGNSFELNSTKTVDDFQHDLTEFKSVGHVRSEELMYFADTVTYNWLHALGGFTANNTEISVNYRGDISKMGQGQLGGVYYTIFATPIGKMKVALDPMLDGSPVKMFGVPLTAVEYAPLVGNGLNRDTSVYKGIQSLETTGVDEQIDLIQTEFGMRQQLPEQFALWA